MESHQWRLPVVVFPSLVADESGAPSDHNLGAAGKSGTASALAALAREPTLSPEELDAAALAAERALLQQGHSDNTARSYRSALRYWAAWALARYRRALSLPMPDTVVVQFIVDHAQRQDAHGALTHELPEAVDLALVRAGFKGKLGPPALNTLMHRLAVVSQLHRAHGLVNPVASARVHELLSRTKRAYAKRGALAHQADALSREPLEALVATCGSTLRDRRDRALLLFAFASGGRRRSEVTAATVENTRLQPDGTYVFTLAHSKTNQEGRERAENHKPVVGRAAQALTEWLQAARITQGPLFRRVRRGNLVAEPLAAAGVRDIVRKRAQRAGLTAHFTAQSLRSGFVTEAGRQGAPLADTMALTGHRSAATLLGYFRAHTASSPAARVLETPVRVEAAPVATRSG